MEEFHIHVHLNGIFLKLICPLLLSLVFLDACLIEHSYMEAKSCISTVDDFNATITSLSNTTKLECALKCSNHLLCVAFEITIEEPYTCILHSRTFQAQRCTTYTVGGSNKFNDMASCLNSGVNDPNTGCTCMSSYIGEHCEHFIEDCTEALNSGSYSGDVDLYIQPQQSPDPFLVHCKMVWGGRTFLMLREPGSVSFNRPWADYKAGFGDFGTEFWLGLDKMHYLTTSKNYTLTVQIYTKIQGSLYRQHYYDHFKISNEENGYAYTVDTSEAHAEPHTLLDCLLPAIGRKFTTTDVDNDDLAGSNCASVHEGGWWFTACGECNPTGPIIKPTDGYLLGIPNEVFWKPGLPNYSVKFIAFWVTPSN